MTMYGLACVISYLPAGWVADKFQARHLIATALVSTGIFGFDSYIQAAICCVDDLLCLLWIYHNYSAMECYDEGH